MSKLKKFGIFCVGIIGLIILIYSIEDLRGRAAWKSFKKKWGAKGEVFDYKQIVPKPIPSGENFAHIPLLKPLLEHNWNKGLTKFKPVDQKKYDRALGLMKIEGRRRPDLVHWNIGQPIDLATWQRFFREEKGWPHPEQAGKTSADVLLALGKFEATMAELSKAAKERPQCRYDIKYEAHFGALLPHLAIYKKFVTSFTLRALAHLGNDDPQSALADIRMCLFLDETIRDEPFLISHLVRIACLKIALQPVWEGLREEKWNAEQLATIEKQLAAIDLLEGYRISILAERDFANLAIDQMRDDPKLLGKVIEDDAQVLEFMPDGWFYHNQKRFNEMCVKFLQTIVSTKARRIHPDIVVAFNKELDARIKRKLPIYDILSSILLPGLNKVAIRFGHSQTAVDHARIACHLELHKLKHKKYPAKLTDLKTPLPHDPYTGKSYVYKPDPKERYWLYGVGWNQKDDGGKVVLRSGGGLNLYEGDLVWRYSPQPAPKKK